MENRDPYRRIRSLMCYATVVSLIKQGTAATEIAQFIQEDVGECLDIGAEHLADLLQKFVRGRHYEDGDASGAGSADIAPQSKIVAPAEVYLSHLTFDDLLGATRKDAAVNIERQMSQAINLQEMRLAEMINKERSTGIFSRDTRREFETYTGMLTHLDQHRRQGSRLSVSTAPAGPLGAPGAPNSGPELLDGAAAPSKPANLAHANFLLGVLHKMRGSSGDVKAQLSSVTSAVINGMSVDDALLLDGDGSPPAPDDPSEGGDPDAP